MGERAFAEAASEDDTRRMQAVVKEAMQAAPLVFNVPAFNHITADDRPVASRLANGTKCAPSLMPLAKPVKAYLKLPAGTRATQNALSIATAYGIWPWSLV